MYNWIWRSDIILSNLFFCLSGIPSLCMGFISKSFFIWSPSWHSFIAGLWFYQYFPQATLVKTGNPQVQRISCGVVALVWLGSHAYLWTNCWGKGDGMCWLDRPRSRAYQWRAARLEPQDRFSARVLKSQRHTKVLLLKEGKILLEGKNKECLPLYLTSSRTEQSRFIIITNLFISLMSM